MTSFQPSDQLWSANKTTFASESCHISVRGNELPSSSGAHQLDCQRPSTREVSPCDPIETFGFGEHTT